MASLATSFSGMSLSGSAAARRGQGLSVSARPTVAAPAGRVSFVVDAAQNALKRKRTAETARVRNKDKKSAIATRIKKVLKTVDAIKKKGVEEADVLAVEALISEATQAIDKGVSKGILKANTGARRKSRLCLVKQRMLIEAGLYTPAN